MAAYTSTQNGAPRSGRFVVGDTVTDGQSIIWRCVRGTSPRQWIATNDPLGSGGVLETITGLTAVEAGDSVVKKTVFTFATAGGATYAATDSFAVADTGAMGGKKIYTFPEGRILVLGALGSLSLGVKTANTTINDAAAVNYSLGTALPTEAALTTANSVDLLPKSGDITMGTNPAYSAVDSNSKTQLAASAHFDGTGGAKAVYLNFGLGTDTQIDVNAALGVTGTITLVWILLGDV